MSAIDTSEVERTLRLIVEPDATWELRALGQERGHPLVLSGYYTSAVLAAEHVARHDSRGIAGWYATLNPVLPELKARCADRLDRAKRGGTTADHQIVQRRRLLFDIDPIRPSGISSTDIEHDASIALACAIECDLCGRGWPKPLRADSGNGAQLVYAIDLPRDDDGLVGRVLAAADARWRKTINEVPLVIDTSVANPSRISKLYGTYARKGDDVTERPHRKARILDAPGQLDTVPREALAALADEFGPQPSTKQKRSSKKPRLDVREWLTEHKIDVRSSGPWTGEHEASAMRYVLATCPANPEHNRGEAFVLQFEGGAISAGCQHDSCVWEWKWFRESRDGNRSCLAGATGGYTIEQGAICRLGTNGPEPLCDFSAEITEDITFDDGAEIARVYVLRGALADGTELSPVRVHASEYARLDWIGPSWGASAIVTAGAQRRDQLREAIQRQSNPERRTVFGQTGWRRIDDEWIYLFHQGSVGSSTVSVELDPPLDRYTLPSAADNLREAVTWSTRLLGCGPTTVTVPLLAAAFLAPLSSIVEPDHAVWLVGPTGSLKSEIAALAQAHFGAFRRKSLPGSWASTENSIESMLHTCADALVTIDDYAPQTDPRAQSDQERVASRVIRAIGNRSARGRMTRDLSRRPERPPRGFVIATGEQLPPGASIQARLIVVEVDRATLDLEEITVMQAHVDRLPHAMRGYVEWLRPQLEELRSTLTKRRDELRDVFAIGGHMRQPEALAQLAIGMEEFLRFATTVGAMTQAEADRWWQVAQSALKQIGRREGREMRDSDPARRFLDIVRDLCSCGKTTLINRVSPPREQGQSDVVMPLGTVIGWRDNAYAYLIPELARKEVVEFLRRAGEHWPSSARSLGEALLRGEYVIAGSDGRPQTQHRSPFALGGRPQRVYQVPICHLDDASEAVGVSEGTT